MKTYDQLHDRALDALADRLHKEPIFPLDQLQDYETVMIRLRPYYEEEFDAAFAADARIDLKGECKCENHKQSE